MEQVMKKKNLLYVHMFRVHLYTSIFNKYGGETTNFTLLYTSQTQEESTVTLMATG